MIELNAEDWDKFVAAVSEATEPNNALKMAALRYKQEICSHNNMIRKLGKTGLFCDQCGWNDISK